MQLSAKLQAKMLSQFNRENYDYIISAFSMISKDNWIRVWDAVTRMESKHNLHQVKCPTLLLIGDHDTLTRRHQPYMHDRIHNSTLRTINNAHHGTNLDNPRAVNEEIMNFIN
jgi:3-oxoadipate enol-lactonase